MTKILNMQTKQTNVDPYPGFFQQDREASIFRHRKAESNRVIKSLHFPDSFSLFLY
jgi:hypothetical protein